MQNKICADSCHMMLWNLVREGKTNLNFACSAFIIIIISETCL